MASGQVSPFDRAAEERALQGVSSYVPRLARGWGVKPGYHSVSGTLVSADISGFTALSERLAAFGREGAEDLTLLLNRCFGEMIEIVHDHGGDVLKFGGDALLVLFTGSQHAEYAAEATLGMRAVIDKRWSTRLASNVELGISQGMHSGTFSLHLVDAGHLELFVCGADMSATVGCEGAANRSEILMTPATAAQLPPGALGEARPEGRILAGSLPISPGPVPQHVVPFDPTPFVPGWLLEQATAARVAEHRQASVGFVFFGGADQVLVEHGAGELQRRLEHLASAVHEAADRHGVYWLASDVYPGGGKVIMSAGAPRSTGQDDDALLRAIRVLLDQDFGLPLRAGVNKGPVFMGDLGSPTRRTFTVMGDAVNLAARLMQKSRPGELVASTALLDNVSTRFALDPLDPFLVKGKTAPIEAALVGELQPVNLDAAPSAETVPFCGRTSELATLSSLLDDARAGHGRVVDLVGEPGIGKTRLVHQLLTSNPDVFTVRTSGGLYSRGSPYFAVRTLLRHVAGVSLSTGSAEAGIALRQWVNDLDPALLPWLPLIAVAFDADVPMTKEVERIGSGNRAERLRDVVTDLLSAALRRPSVLVIDDAYWLDRASHELFLALGSRARSRPWLILALRRDGLDCFATENPDAAQLVLGPLAPEDTRALALAAIERGVGPATARVDDLVARGGSNPLFVLELVRAAAQTESGDPLPGSIESLVTARIDLLSSRNRLLLREASVLGAVVDLGLFAEVTESPLLARPDAWSELSSFFHAESRGSLRFQHALFRDVAYSGLSFHRRGELHAGVGTVLETRAGADWPELSEILSIHFDHARDWARSWKYSAAAGDRARAKYANVEAAGFYDRALASSRRCRVDPPAVATVAESLGDVSELSGSFSEAAAAYHLASRKTTDPAASVRLMRKQGVVREREGRYPQALRWYGRGLSGARGLDDSREQDRAEGALALAYAGVRWRQGRFRDVTRWSHHAEALANQLGDDAMLAHACYLLDLSYTALRDPRRAEYRGRALPLFERVGDLVGQANTLNNLGLAAREEGDWEQSLELYERSRQARELTGDVVGAATAALNAGEILSDQGHLDRAEPLMRSALATWQRAKYPIGIAVATSYLGRLLARRRNFEAARTHLDEAITLFRRIRAQYFILETEIFRAELILLEGNPTQALASLEELAPRVDALGEAMLKLTVLRLQAWALYLCGADSTAADAATESAERAERIGARAELAYALLIRAFATANGDDRDRALTLFSALGVVDNALPAQRNASDPLSDRDVSQTSSHPSS